MWMGEDGAWEIRGTRPRLHNCCTKSLIEFKREPSKGQGKKIGGSSKGGGDPDKSPKKDKWKGKKDEAPKKYSCLLCKGPRWVFKCPKRGKLVASVQGEEEKQEEERKISSLKLLNTNQAKVEGQPRGHMYVETIINGKPLQAMLDTGANTVYIGARSLSTRWACPTPRRRTLSRG